MKIYTKTGDQGLTSLLSNERVEKSDLRIEAYGTVDELNAHIGLLKDQPVNQERIGALVEIQNCLFIIGAMMAANGKAKPGRVPGILHADVAFLEKSIDDIQQSIPALRSFVLPGGHASVSFGHVARTVCRRAERAVVAVAKHQEIDRLIVTYLNRLSDYLFVLCRKMASELGAVETPWRSREQR